MAEAPLYPTPGLLVIDLDCLLAVSLLADVRPCNLAGVQVLLIILGCVFTFRQSA